jgi:hypothetical protein
MERAAFLLGRPLFLADHQEARLVSGFEATSLRHTRGYRRLSNESSNAKNIAKMVAKLLGRLLNEDHRCNSASTCAHHDRSGCKARNLLAHQSTHRTADRQRVSQWVAPFLLLRA